MCGISCTICSNSEHGENIDSLATATTENDYCENWKNSTLEKLLRNRGPNVSGSKSIFSNHGSSILLSAHVLWTQGLDALTQPCCDEDESKIFVFNGDIYSFDSDCDTHLSVTESQLRNDSLELFQRFCTCEPMHDYNLVKFCDFVSNLRGPFAFILYDKHTDTIWFARDFFGRESLLFSCDAEKMIISSVSPYDKVYEIPAAGVYSWDLRLSKIKLYNYECHERKGVLENLDKFNLFLKDCGIELDRSTDTPKIKLSFTTVLKSPDVHGIDRLDECNLQKIIKCVQLCDENKPEEVLKSVSKVIEEKVNEFLFVLRNSVNVRISCQPNFCKNCIRTRKKCVCSKVAVLFSGGLDSTVLAYLALELLPPGESLDLINIAFSKTNNFLNIPDRETGLESYKVLKNIFEPQGKHINFVCADVQKEEVETMREEIIRVLISPLTSVLDDSIGCCLWFAGRCSGRIGSEKYTSPTRVVLLGSGADELLGGYERHRNAYKKSGWLGLLSEMQEDIDRISVRNLGRDNRIVSDHGVCPRMPFLDENVVSFLAGNCDLWLKCCPLDLNTLNQRGVGEKLLLRATAVKLLGEENIKVAMFPKRAMQFGSRIAKLENSKEKGSDKCSRLTSQS